MINFGEGDWVDAHGATEDEKKRVVDALLRCGAKLGEGYLFTDSCKLVHIGIRRGSVYYSTDAHKDFAGRCYTLNEFLSEQEGAGHPHAQAMIEYGQDSLTDPEPWRNWEYRMRNCTDWAQCSSHPAWGRWLEYRRRPRELNINGRLVPEPMRRAPEYGTEYWVARLGPCPVMHMWRNDKLDRCLLEMGLIHSTESAARAHSDALLSFTKSGE